MIKIKSAMILAAGFGTRMRPITNHLPKALIPIRGRPLIDHLVGKLKAHGIERIIINTHYLADQMEAHFKGDSTIVLSYEPEILESGGGVLKVLDYFEGQPFFTVNGDVLWDNTHEDPLCLLEDSWDPKNMDLELMLVPRENAIGYHNKGDYFMSESNILRRRNIEPSAPYVFGPLAIVHPKIFQGIHPHKFSMLELYDQVQEKNRLYGALFHGGWYHLGTPEDLDVISNL